MNSEKRERLLEELEDARMKLLMDEYAEAEGDRLLREFEEAKANGALPEVPVDLDEKCRKIINQSFAAKRRENIHRMVLHGVAKAAAWVMIILGIGATTVMSVEALRIPVLNFFLETQKGYSATSFDSNDTKIDIHQSVLERLKSTRTPSGFTLAKLEEKESGIIRCYYTNKEDGVINIEVVPAQGRVNFDIEDAAVTPTEINGHDAIIYEKEDFRLSWMDAEKGVMFNFYAVGVPQNECIRMVNYLAE